jgi:lauroyl/myristoyl acyltransferase/mitochondrial fission protein ELM1
MSSLSESISYSAVKVMAALARLLPNGLVLKAGQCIGSFGYYLSPAKRRRIAYNNLRIAFCDTKTDPQIKAILKKCYQHYGQNIVELLRLPLISRTGYEKVVTLEGKEHIDQAIAAGRGVIFLAIHSGSWELSSMVGSMVGYPYNLIANPQKNAFKLNDLLNSYRAASGCKIILPGEGTREIIRRLKANEIVTLVADQGGAEGELTEFFGRQASMSTGAIRLALKYGAAICLVDISREKGGRHRLVVDKPLEMVRTGKEKDDRAVNLSAVVRRFEGKIRRHPHEYMWFYKIWKYSSNVNVVILDDGRTGHLRQSQALAETMAQVLAARGKTVREHTVQVAFRSKFLKKLCSFLSILGQWLPGFRSTGWLRLMLTPESFKRLTSVKADYLLSCGSAVACVHFLSTPWQMAKSIVILKPGLLSLRGFDLVVLPQHDKPAVIPTQTRVAITKAAPNLINEKYLAEQTELLLSRYSHLKNNYRTKIGILLGGNTKNVEFTESMMKIIVHQIKEVAQQLNADILLTTSRRTPEHVEQLIWRELKKFDRCALLISAHQGNVPEAVGGILGLSDFIVVSGESISMVSEAVSSGKKTVVFRVGSSITENAVTDLGKNKYEKFVDRLNEQGYLVSCSPKGIGQALYSVMREKIRIKPLNDREILKNAVEQVV